MSLKFIQTYVHICENVLRDVQTETLSFINVRHRYVSEVYPSSVGRFYVAAGFKMLYSSKTPPKLDSQLKIMSPDNKIVLDLKQAVPLDTTEGKIPHVDFVFKIERFVCNIPGTYRIQLIDFPNELILGETEFEAVYPPRPQIIYKTDTEIEELLKQKNIIKKVESSVSCPQCKHEKKFVLEMEKDLFKRMEQELHFPEDLVYRCENCGKWSIHLGRMLHTMYSKLGQKVSEEKSE